MRAGGGGDFSSENGFVQRCVSGPGLPAPGPGSPGRREASPQPGFRLNTGVGLVVTAGNPSKSESQLPDLSKLKTQEANGHGLSPRTHQGDVVVVVHGWRTSRRRCQSLPRARPRKGGAQVMSRLPASPSSLSICETSQQRNVPAQAGSAFIPPRTPASLLLSLRRFWE